MITLNILAELLFFSFSILQKHQQCPRIRSQMKDILMKKSHRPDDILEIAISSEKEEEEIEILIFNLNRIVENMIKDFSNPEILRDTLKKQVPDCQEELNSGIGQAYVSRLKEFQQWIYLLTVQLKDGRTKRMEPLLA